MTAKVAVPLTACNQGSYGIGLPSGNPCQLEETPWKLGLTGRNPVGPVPSAVGELVSQQQERSGDGARVDRDREEGLG